MNNSDPKKTVDVVSFVHAVAKKRGWKLNGDADFLDMLVEGLQVNSERLGYLQCPCRLSWDDRSKDRDIICPCVYAADDIAEYGHCFCSLFFSADFDFSSQEISSIPERRPEHLFP
jgi:ferredoxin-thioredoxin reductase catalytic subunit